MSRPIQSLSPYSQEVYFQSDFSTETDLNGILETGETTVRHSDKSTIGERAACFMRLKELLEKDKKSLGELITGEMGKPIQESVAEVEKCAHLCGFYAMNAEKWLQPKIVEQGNGNTAQKRVEYHPLGLILGIMPWNFPFWQVFRCAVPTVLTGNVILLKHAPNVPLCALKIEELFIQAGFNKGVYQNLFISEEQVAKVLADPRLRGVSLTGSEKAGRSVAALAGAHLKKQVLELGGSDPYIVMPSADLPKAIDWAVNSRLISNGQSCIAAKRFIIQEDIYESFLNGLKEQLSTLAFGDPLDPAVRIGPLARRDLADQLRSQIKSAVSAGAKIEAEYFFKTDNPHFVPITLLVNIQKDNPVYTQELFGPVFVIHKVKNSKEALALANDSPFGLGASVWTNDRKEQELFINQLEAGGVFINVMVSSNAAMPFGGIKNSGYGRELSEEGLKEFCNIKAVVINNY